VNGYTVRKGEVYRCILNAKLAHSNPSEREGGVQGREFLDGGMVQEQE